MRSTRVALLATAAVLVAGASVGYGASRNDTTRVGASAYKLKEMAVIGPRTVASGRVTLTAKNLGTVEHELVVFKGAGPLTVKNFKAVEAGRALGEIPETAGEYRWLAADEIHAYPLSVTGRKLAKLLK